jgi:hypothetical protein
MKLRNFEAFLKREKPPLYTVLRCPKKGSFECLPFFAQICQKNIVKQSGPDSSIYMQYFSSISWPFRP